MHAHQLDAALDEDDHTREAVVDTVVAFAEELRRDPVLWPIFEAAGLEGEFVPADDARLSEALAAWRAQHPRRVGLLAASVAFPVLRKVAAGELSRVDDAEARAFIARDFLFKETMRQLDIP